MMKRLILSIVALLFATQAIATEHVGAFSSLTLDTGVTLTDAGTSLTFSNVWAKGARKIDPTIHKGDTLDVDLTIANYSGTGSLATYVTGNTGSCGSGTWVNSPNGYHGEFDINDNFTTANALASTVSDFPPNGVEQREPDPNGSFRFKFNPTRARHARDDPMVCPGAPGRSHLHEFNGNLGANAYSTYKTLRKTGGSNCSPDAAPVCRGAYWWPDMLNSRGGIVEECCILTYYKVIPSTFAECKHPGDTYDATVDSTKVGICIPYPNGLRYISGFNMATGFHGPGDNTDPTSEAASFIYQCHGQGFRAEANHPDPNDNIRYSSIDAAVASGNPNCAVGPTNYLYMTLSGPQCWDGTHLDSPDHRSHVAFPTSSVALSESNTFWVNSPNLAPAGAGDTVSAGSTWAKCPTAFPYLIATLSIQKAYKIDADFVAGRWHLSCDEQMSMSMAAGACSHFDYWEAWSPSIKNLWTVNCNDGRNSGNNGELCQGQKIAGADGANGGDESQITETIAMTTEGWSKLLSGNQTFHVELKAQADGEIGLYAVGGFTGKITNWTVTNRTATGKANGVTVTSN